MKYLPIFPELAEELEELDDAQVGRMIRAMSAYAFEGREPDFPRGSAERILWPVFRLKIDGWRDKSEKKAAAGAAGGEANGSKPKQTEADESKPKQTEANESKAKPQSQSQTQSQTESEEDDDTHGEILPEPSPGARARRAGWYDPDRPAAACDRSWMVSEPARRAIAQRIIERVLPRIDTAPVITGAGPLGQELLRALDAAMQAGIPPGECQQIGEIAGKAWIWEGRLKQIALDGGTAPPDRTQAWRDQVGECAEDLYPPPLIAFG